MGCYLTLRRTISLAAFLASIWVPSLALAAGVDNDGLPRIPLHIVNNIATDQDLFVYITGLVTETTGDIQLGTAVYVSDDKGNVAIVPEIPGDSPQSLALDVGTLQDVRLMLPKLAATRIYLSIGKPILVNAGQKGTPPSSPNSWDPTSLNGVNFATIWDFAEFTWLSNPATPGGATTNLGINVTEVDSLGFPLQFELRGQDANGQAVALTSGFRSDTERGALFNALAAAGAPWSGLILTDTDGTQLRALAPNLGIMAGVFPGDQLQSYIDQVFLKYATDSLTAVTNPVPNVTQSFTGQVSGDHLVFTDQATGQPAFQFPKWSTLQAYAGEIHAVPKPDNERYFISSEAIGAALQAAQMRTTLLENPNLRDAPGACDQPPNFYTNDPVNMYAKLMHDSGIGGLAYAFGFDDSCSQSSFKLVFAPTHLTLTLPGNRGS